MLTYAMSKHSVTMQCKFLGRQCTPNVNVDVRHYLNYFTLTSNTEAILISFDVLQAVIIQDIKINGKKIRHVSM